MKRLSVVMIVIIALSALLTACGGGAAAADPVGAVKEAMQSVVDKKFDRLVELTCTAKRAEIEKSLNPAEALGAAGVDANKILDAMTISLQNPEYTKISEEGDKAVVQFKGKMAIKFDLEKFKAVMKEVLAAQGQTVTDEQLDQGLQMLVGTFEQGQDLDQKIEVVKENGKWVYCGEVQ
ncbi:hypothetical protein TFLX_01975 [Thermoflexales bacterium]|nr:hypothetical protein TFLX_01975 [Thermoflexales bacterium]